MAKYQIRYGLGGGFGGCGDWEDASATTEDAANLEAWERACEEYDMYDGLHGLRNVEMIMEEDDVDETEAFEIYEEERESWLYYEVRAAPKGKSVD